MKIKTAICGVICLSAGSVYAGTYAVPSQYATIQAAITAASDNSVINVAPGTYNEQLNFGTKKMLTINGTGGAAATIIDGGSTGPILAVGPMSMAGMPVTMSGFTFQNGYSSVNGGVANLAATSELVILNSVITKNQGGTGGAFSVNGGNLKIRNSVISGNTAIDTGSAIYVANGKAYLVNDTVTANTSADGSAINQQYGATVSGINDIVYGNLRVDGSTGASIFNGPLTATFTYSDIEGGFTGTGNIDVAPGFVDPATGNFQLTAVSAAIDSGSASTSSLLPTVAIDLLGAARPQGAAYDMGAYEFVAPALPPVNGTCGGSNGGTFTIAPTADLCSTGTASAVTGTGPFAWTCDGSNGGTSASCSAQLQVVTPPADTTAPEVVSVDTSGATSSNSFAFPVTFTEGIVLVKSGIKVGTYSGMVTVSGTVATIKLDQASPVKDQVYTLTIPAGTFRDSAGNLNILYTAPITFANGKIPPPPPVNGACGSANGSAFEIAPTTNLCSAGTSSVVTGVGPYYWSCAGSNGGTTTSCSAQYQAPAGNTDITPPAVISVDTSGAMTSNSFAFPVTFTEGIVFIKSGVKVGTYSGMVTVSGAVATIKLDQANPVKGQVYTLTIPAGTFRDAAGNLNTLYTAQVTFANGSNPPPPPVVGVCGSANGGAFEVAPTSNLCSTGTASAVTGVGPYNWSCAGSNGGATASCSAQYQPPANNTDVTPPAVVSVVTNSGTTSNSNSVTVTFTEGIVKVKSGVKVGTYSGMVTVSGAVATIKLDQASPVKGQVYTLTIPAGTFRDAAGNLNALYTAPVIFSARPPVNGVCGSSNGAFFLVAPTTNLCTTGTATAVSGTGPFAWTCGGSNGGTTASCSAQLQAPPVDVTAPTVVSTVVTGTTISSDVIKITFTEAVTSTNKTIMIGTAQTTYTVSGSAVSFKIKSCCLNKVKVGSTYNLVIPAGSFKDAAGNPNTAITVAVKL
jgi:glutamine cyclotransferase